MQNKFGGEIVSADSMQIYQDMTIGTAKPTVEEMQGIKHYIIDCILPSQRYSVSDYKRDAMQAIGEILQKGKTPIVVGGTGLYINSIIKNIQYPELTLDEEYREYLNQIVEKRGLEVLYQKALTIDPQAMEKISPNDQKRIMRVLEIYKQTGKTKTEQEIESKKQEIPYDYKVFAISLDRAILYDRINKRVDIMIQNGLIQEVKNLLKKYKNFPTALQGLGYKETKQYLDGEITKEEMIEKIKQESRKYAKRQFTWFRKNKEILWLDGMENLQKNISIILEQMR